MADQKPSDLQVSLCLLLKTFSKYAGGIDEKDTIKKKELQSLLKNELPLLSQELSGGEAEGMMGELDLDGDGTVTFQEFCIFVCKLAVALKMVIAECAE